MLRFPFVKIAISNLLTAKPFKYSSLARPFNQQIADPKPKGIDLVERDPFVGEKQNFLKKYDCKRNMGINEKRGSKLQQTSLAALRYIENKTHEKMRQNNSKRAIDTTTYFPGRGLFQNLRMSSWTLSNAKENCYISGHKEKGGFRTRGKM